MRTTEVQLLRNVLIFRAQNGSDIGQWLVMFMFFRIELQGCTLARKQLAFAKALPLGS